jgi:hypothetical protein
MIYAGRLSPHLPRDGKCRRFEDRRDNFPDCLDYQPTESLLSKLLQCKSRVTWVNGYKFVRVYQRIKMIRNLP